MNPVNPSKAESSDQSFTPESHAAGAMAAFGLLRSAKGAIDFSQAREAAMRLWAEEAALEGLE